MSIAEYREGTPFPGHIGVTTLDSSPAWPAPTRARDGAPNVLIVMLDDVGYAQIGCYGSDIDTPTFDTLAAGGIRYTRYHTTALCSPTRAALMTGRNHHSVGMAVVPEMANGYPGSNARIPASASMLPAILREQGYATYAVGKWHLTPEEDCNAAGSRARWPLGQGFDRFYGFMGGQTDQWSPELVCDNHFVEPRSISLADHGESVYHLTADLCDQAITMIRDLKAAAPTKPFFTYLALGACHCPHHVPAEWIEKYRGRFDLGWDAWREDCFARQKQLGLFLKDAELPPRESDVREWTALPAGEQRLYARMMEVFAGFLSHADHHVGRVIDFLQRIGELDNTIVLIMSDNGASAEGGPNGTVNEARLFNMVAEDLGANLAQIDDLGTPRTRQNYPTGWTMAGCTPFRRWKTEIYRGGVTDPLILHWPAGVPDRGGLRHQWCHVTDITPTLLDLLGVEAPTLLGGVAQSPLEGTSFAGSVASADAPTAKQVQYFEMFGQRAIWAGGWKALHRHRPIVVGNGEKLAQLDWELYNIDSDPTECHNLAAQHPEIVERLANQWWVEAGRYNVLPLRADFQLDAERPLYGPRPQRVRYARGVMVQETAAINVKNRTHHVRATITLGHHTDHGTIVAQGTRFGGWCLFVQGGHLHTVHNDVGRAEHHHRSATPIPTGRPVAVGFDLVRTADHRGVVTLRIDGDDVGGGEVCTVPTRYEIGSGSLRVGDDAGVSVTARYEAPHTFTGALDHVEIEVEGTAWFDPHAEFNAALRSQ